MYIRLCFGKYRRFVAVVLCAVGAWALTAPVGAWAEASTALNGAPIPTAFETSSPPMFVSTLKMLGGLCFCLGLLALGARIMRKMPGCQSPSRRRRLEIREKLALSSRAALYVVAVDNREYLIASGSDSTSITPTHSITTPLFAESLDEVCEEVGELHA